jgi:hypothetical protein
MATTYKRKANKAAQSKTRETRQAYPTMTSADLNAIALQLQASLNAVGEQLALFNALLMRINHVTPGPMPTLIQPTNRIEVQTDNQAWLSLSESSFKFWENEEDAVYDTL